MLYTYTAIIIDKLFQVCTEDEVVHPPPDHHFDVDRKILSTIPDKINLKSSLLYVDILKTIMHLQTMKCMKRMKQLN